MHRFFISAQDIHDTTALIKGDEARHLMKVLRLKVGHKVHLFDGDGFDYEASIVHLEKTTVHLSILESRKAPPPDIQIDVGQCLVKKNKMELIVQKSTELGMGCLTPIISQNCSLNYKPEGQIDRWQKIAQEACKQCGRSYLPSIHPPGLLSDFLDGTAHYQQKVFLWEQEKKHLFPSPTTTTVPTTVLVLIGPEGGFTEEEAHQIIDADFQPVTLGNNTLRAETAAISALAITKYIYQQESVE